MRIVSFLKLCEEDVSELIKIQKNKAFMKNLPEHFSELEQKFSSVKSSMEKLMVENAALKQEIVRLNDWIDKIEDKYYSLNFRFLNTSEDYYQRLNELETENSSLTEKIEFLFQKNKKLGERILQNETRINNLVEDNKKLIKLILLLNTENKSQNDRIRIIVGN